MSGNPLFLELLKARGLTQKADREVFLNPDYKTTEHDPFLLPDMKTAVERLAIAQKKQQKVVIYGDYDIDGITATALLLDAFKSFGILAGSFIPNRFVEGYGLSLDAVEQLAENGAELIITVDCGSLSHAEVARANELGIDVIVTDHHTVAETMPPAVAVINPKRSDHKYPFIDLAGVGVAFKLVQALQTRLKGLPIGQEKWLLDLVALGTVCDVVTLADENRANVFWGLRVLAQTRRPGLKALMAVSAIDEKKLNARALGFGLGPRLNASGRLKTAELSLELLTATDNMRALAIAEELQKMNLERRKTQDIIFQEAVIQAETMKNLPVLVLSDPSWSHGIVGIVSAKILERYKKPTFVIQELEDGKAKGSARSFGDFSAVGAIRATETYLIKGGGHKLAAGITLETTKITVFRDAINVHYKSLKLKPQTHFLEPKADVTTDSFENVDEDLMQQIAQLEPYGHGNPEPVFCFSDVTLFSVRLMGAENQHARLILKDKTGRQLNVVIFNADQNYQELLDEKVDAWVNLTINEWRGVRTVEGRLIKLTQAVI